MKWGWGETFAGSKSEVSHKDTVDRRASVRTRSGTKHRFKSKSTYRLIPSFPWTGVSVRDHFETELPYLWEPGLERTQKR